MSIPKNPTDARPFADFHISQFTLDRIEEVRLHIAECVKQFGVEPQEIVFKSDEGVRQFFGLPFGRTFNYVLGLPVVIDPDANEGRIRVLRRGPRLYFHPPALQPNHAPAPRQPADAAADPAEQRPSKPRSHQPAQRGRGAVPANAVDPAHPVRPDVSTGRA